MLSLVGEAESVCSKCSELLPLRAFSVDARLKSGRRGVCKRCDRRATRLRRNRASGRESRPAPPRPAREQSSTLLAAAELTIGALDPPAGDADAVLVELLRTIARLADEALDDGDVRGFCRCAGLVIRILRELLATRASAR